MRTATGEAVETLRIRVSDGGWSWLLPDDKRLAAEEIDGINQELTELGVVLDPLVLEFPIAQILCG